jgi:hypothetical protein
MEIDTLGLTALDVENPTTEEYGGCYSPCSKLTMNHWGNTDGTNSPDHPPADKYCCGGDYDTLETCQHGPDPTSEYTQVVHDNCNVYAWAYDDAIGLEACDTTTTMFAVTFYGP